MIHTPFTFSPSGGRVANRTLLAPLTNGQSNDDGTLHEDELRWLVRRAAGGFGVITTCAAHVSLDGQGWKGELGAFDDAMIPGLTRLASALRAEGSFNVVQLVHTGVRAPSSLTGQQPWSASAFEINVKGVEPPRAATVADIEGVIANFAAAAARCEAAGFDGVELHGAHGYLLTQFLGTVTNLRTDGWGGDLDGRARLLFETLAAVKAAVSPGFTVGVRLSAEVREQGVTLDDSLEVAGRVAAAGADYLHASLWDAFKPSAARPDTALTTLFRAAVPTPCALVVTGSIWSPAQAATILQQGADLVGVGRAAIGNPDWARQIADPAWEPLRPPFTAEHLRSVEVSPAFLGYLQRFPGLMAPQE